MNEIKKDTNLREAVRRSVQQLPPLPDDLNARLLQRLEAQEAPSGRRALPHLLRWAAVAVVLSGMGLLGLKFGTGKTAPQPTTETPPVAEAVAPAPPVVLPEHKEPQEILPQAAENTAASKHPRLRKQKSALAQAEAEPTPEDSAEAKVETEQEYLPTTPDPFLLAAAEAQDIRARGERLCREVVQMINNH